MGDRKLSDEIVEQLLRSDADISEVQEQLSDSSDFIIDESDEFVDDSDADPHYDPYGPSTSSRLPLGKRKIPDDLQLSDTSSDDEELPNLNARGGRSKASARGRPKPTFSGRGRGRPRGTNLPNLQLSDNEMDVDEDNIQWENVENEDPEVQHNFSFNELPGIKHCPSPTSKPIAYFNMFFTFAFLSDIVKETNRYAKQYMNEKGHNFSFRNKLRNWTNVTVPEITAFIAVLLNMGLIRKPNVKSYWSTSISQGTSWFPKMFSRDRFESIFMFFHLVDNTTLAKNTEPDYDATAKFQPAVKHANAIFRHHYTPNQQLSIDESLVGTKNHTRILQYLPNKHHHKWGIKLWMICDSVTNYCLGFTVYKGARDGKEREQFEKKGTGPSVVLQLLDMCNYLYKGHHIFVDNFFTSFPLLRELYEKQTFLTGTIRRNRKSLPDDVKRKFSIGEKKYYRSNYMLTLAYREKASQTRPVILVSSDAQAKDTEIRKIKFGKEITKNKPSIICKYNKFMGGIDTSDMMLYAYMDERRSPKYWKKVVLNIFGRMMLNAYIIYKMNCVGRPMSRYTFTASIVDQITYDWLNIRGEMPPPVGPGGDAPTQTSPRNQALIKLPGKQEKCCVVCSKISLQQGGKKKRSRTACSKCNRGLHGLCLAQHKC